MMDTPAVIPRFDKGDSYPLSFAQQRLWFLEQLAPNTPVHNIIQAKRLEGPLDADALAAALDSIVARHAVLRTTFVVEGNRPQQRVAPNAMWPLKHLNVSGLSPEEQRHSVAREFKAVASGLYDLARGPLIRGTLITLGDTEHLLALGMHHIVSDGWSYGLLWRELAEQYAAYISGKPACLPTLSLQYGDFARWQHGQYDGGAWEDLMRHWQTRLADLPVLELPTDRPRPPVQSHAGQRWRFPIPREVAHGARALAQQSGATAFMVLLANFYVLLHRYSDQDDIAVGTVVAGRNRRELEQLIGFLVNTLVLRVDLSGQPTFSNLIALARAATLDAIDHQDLPFEKLVEVLKPSRELSRNPLFQVMFTLRNQAGPLKLGDASATTFDDEVIMSDTSKFDLTLTICESTDSFSGVFSYSTALFEHETIERMSGHYVTLLKDALARPDTPISKLRILTDDEERQLLVDWNQTAQEYPRDVCVHELIAATAQKTPHSPALVFKDATLTYAELNRRANQLAHYLRRRGVHTQTPVAICVERGLEMAVGLLGILKAGGTYIPLDPSYPVERLRYLLNDSDAAYLLTQEHLGPQLPPIPIPVTRLDSDWPMIARQPPHEVARRGRPEDLAYLIYTSGSTGEPKGVGISHRALVNQCFAALRYFDLGTGQRRLQSASLGFDVAVAEIFPTWVAGDTVVLWPEDRLSSLAELLRFAEQQQLTIIGQPSSYWHEWVTDLQRGASYVPDSLRMVVVGSEPVMPDRLQAWLDHVGTTVRWCNAYGPTETTITATIYEPAPRERVDDRGVVPIGRPLANTLIFILDKAGHPVPVGVPGEIHIGGERLAQGYHKRPRLTAEKFIEWRHPLVGCHRLYASGDIGRYRADGQIEFLGRRDEQIKIRGYRIELGEIEAVLGQHPKVQDAVVVPWQDSGVTRGVVTYVVAAPGASVEPDELRGYLQERLPSYMVPAEITLLEALPLTEHDKLDRERLPVPGHTFRASQEGYVPPRNPTEEKIADIWAQALEIEPIGVNANFFDLGGHSLIATRVVGLIGETLNVEVSLREIFEKPTVAELAAAISNTPRKRRTVIPTRGRRQQRR